MADPNFILEVKKIFRQLSDTEVDEIKADCEDEVCAEVLEKITNGVTLHRELKKLGKISLDNKDYLILLLEGSGRDDLAKSLQDKCASVTTSKYLLL